MYRLSTSNMASKQADFGNWQYVSNTIKLVCLGSSSQQAAIVNLFHQLGYRLFIEGRQGLVRWTGSGCQWIDHLGLAGKHLRVEPIVKAILATPNAHHFVISPSPLGDAISPILDACNDFCRWPVDPFELAFRLQRLSNKQGDATCLGKVDRETVAWKNLNLIGQSSLFLDALTVIKKAAQCAAPVLIEGETGCGKEVAARAIHYLGCRKDFPFIALNCGAIPDQLIENELFGHEKGAYTDAKQSQVGLTTQADGGTLFLDEIEALSAKGQVALLRFIEDHVVKPLGGTNGKKVDVRIVAASNERLSELVAQGLFRQDLLFRLNLLHLDLPPLRRRKDDIQPLAEHFLQKYRSQYQQPDKRFHPKTVEWMCAYHWPGNVRELENFVHRSFLLSDHPEIAQTDLDHEHKTI